MNRIRIPVGVIRMDGGTQPRAVLDFDAINDYSDAMSAGAKFPPVTAFYDGEHYWLADGFHRVRAAYAADFETIECDVRQGTLEDAQWFSFGANSSNGLRRTNEDKQRAVKSALTHPRAAGLSDNEIARHCGVTQPTVAHWRGKLGLSSKILKIESRTVTRKGKTYLQKIRDVGRRKQRHDRSATQKRLESVIDAALVIANCEVPVEELAKHLTSRQDRHQIISAMEKACDFLKLCASEARSAGIADESGEQTHAAARADDCDAGDGAGVAREERCQQPPGE